MQIGHLSEEIYVTSVRTLRQAHYCRRKVLDLKQLSDYDE